MKKLLIPFSLAMALATAANSQVLFFAGTSVGDTLVNQDTATYYMVDNAIGHNYLAVTFGITLVSGTVGGTISYQVANPRTTGTSNTAVLWYTVSSQTITGSGQTLYYFGRDVWERRVRIQIITPAGTRRQAVRYEGRITKV